MINIRPLIEQRIKDTVPELTEVAGSSDLSTLLTGRVSDGGCYIMPESDTATPNGRVNAVAQRNQEQFAVIFTVSDVRDPRGADAADVCNGLRAKVLSALLGWVPESSCEMVEKVNGRLISFTGGYFIWKDVYQTAQFIHS